MCHRLGLLHRLMLSNRGMMWLLKLGRLFWKMISRYMCVKSLRQLENTMGMNISAKRLRWLDMHINGNVKMGCGWTAIHQFWRLGGLRDCRSFLE